MGTPYKGMDRFACAVMWLSGLVVALILLGVNGEIVLPWVVLGCPLSVGLASMIAHMIDRVTVTRVIAVLYAVGSISGALLLGAAA